MVDWFRGRRLIAWAGLIYLIVAVAFTQSILKTDQLIGAKYSGSLSFWAVWFPPHALQDNYDLSYNFYSLYPQYTNWLPYLSLPTSLIYSLLKIPFGVTLAYNLLIPLYLTLTALFAYIWLRQHSPERRGLPMVMALLFAFNPLTFEWAKQGDLPLLAWFGLPMVMWLWDKWLEKLRFEWLLLLVAAFYCEILLSIQYWNLILTTVLPYAVYRFYKRRGIISPKDTKFWGDSTLMGGLMVAVLFLIFPASAVLWSTYYLRYEPLEIWQGIILLSGWKWNILVYGGFLAIIGALSIPWEINPHRRWWMVIFGLNLLLYFRPQLAPLTLLGDLFQVHYNPELTQSYLFLMPVLLSGSVLVMQGLGVALSWTDYNPAMPYAVYIMLGGVILWSSGWWQPLPTSDLPALDYYGVMADEPENYLVVNFPLGADNLARRELQASNANADAYPAFNFEGEAGRNMAYVPYHHKRLLGGYLPLITPEDLQAYQISPLVQLLTFQLDKTNLQQLIDLRRDVVRWRAGFVVLRQGQVEPQFEQGLRGWMRWTDTFCWVHEEQGLEFWRASWHPAGCPAYEIRIGAEEGDLAAGEGWYGSEFWDRPIRWADANANLTLWVTNPATDYTLTILAASHEQIPLQTVTVMANGEDIGEIELTPQASEQSLTIPRLTIAEGGILKLTLEHSESVDVDGRNLSAVYETFRLEAEN